jgi:D-alanyl-lipoteichoic acid acyltransferase DltB (MBOAT superfamily)
MLFNSIDFAIFLPLVFGAFWLLPKSRRWQNCTLLLASLIFYGWWDYRFLSLILFSTIVDFIIGQQIHKTRTKSKRKILLGVSLFTNLGLLGFFKYFNFFQDSFIEAFKFFGSNFEGYSLSIILPVGISFYTFQTLSYTIDVYRKEMKPVAEFIDFATFVTFFPQLVAGPIERAKTIIPQLQSPRIFDYQQAKSGIHLIIFGLFRKIVIADNLGIYVDRIWQYPNAITPYMVVLASVFFSVQIYMDFSGYSRIARGVAQLFGVKLMVNFNYPYKATSFSEFWSRWHISLSTWFRDYLYIPLGGNRRGSKRTLINLCLVFTISGLWHGADWSFVIWGFMHFLLLASERFIKLPKSKFMRLLKWANVLFMVNLTWILFRADTITQAWVFISLVFKYQPLLGYDSLTFQSPFLLALNVFLVIGLPILLMIERKFYGYKSWQQNAFLIGLLLFTSMFLTTGETFIYFQF